MRVHLEVLLFSVLISVPALAQPAPESLTIRQAVERAVAGYPAVRGAAERAQSAAAAINLARTSYLPRADFLAQVNRATRNNVFGLLLPQSVIPGISGPVLGTNDVESVWGSAVGVLASWEPFDFGLRRANVDAAEASRTRADADADVTLFQVEAATADAFLTLLAAQQNVGAAQAGVERARVLSEVADALAQSGMRPGADAARARAELAAARTQLARAEQAVGIARASLSALVGQPPAQITLQAGPLLEMPSEALPVSGTLADNPLARRQQAAVEEVQAVEHTLSRSYFPRFNLQAASYARGTGARADGSGGGQISGFGPNIQNWALGMTMQFNVSDVFSLRDRQRIELHRERAESAQYDRVMKDLGGQLDAARATLEGARQVAALTVVQLESARTALDQATARYKSGLGNVAEAADTQRLVAQSEADDALAKLGVWRGLLAMAAARGDLEPFLLLAGK